MFGRGNVGDFDPNHFCLEVYSFYGMYNAKNYKLVFNDTSSNDVYWDGSLIPSRYYRIMINKQNYVKGSADRLLSAYSVYNKIFGEYSKDDDSGDYPLFHGDIIGDWREEFIITNKN